MIARSEIGLKRTDQNVSIGPAIAENYLNAGVGHPESGDADTLTCVLPFSRQYTCGKGETVPMGGAQNGHVFYIEKGAVEVFYTEKETKIVVAIIGEGDFFGEIGFFDGESRVTNARAAYDSTLRIFGDDTIQRIRIQDPLLYGDFITLLTQSICKKFRRVLEESEPIVEYAASLTTGGQRFDTAKPLPQHFLNTDSWKTVSQMAEDFKARFFDLSGRVQGVTDESEDTAFEQDCLAIMDDLNAQLQVFNPPDAESESAYAWGYLFKELFPYLMRSRMAERAYYKPKGYAGDFIMMEMIYADQPSGDGKLGDLLDRWFLRSSAAEAVRGRRELLTSQLSQLTEARVRESETVRIMNLACGPNRELFDFLIDCDYTDAIEAFCIDIDKDALQYTNQEVNCFYHQATIHLMRENLVKWALGRVRHGFGGQDIIYSAGLMDYLNDKMFVKMIDRCHEQLKPGGVLILGNFGMDNPNRNLMDHLLHWSLIYRGEESLRDLFSRSRFNDDIQVLSEKQGVNLFAMATKS